MRKWIRSCTVAAAAVLSLAGIPAAIVTIHPSGVANADVCASAGRRISVGGCVDVGQAIADYAPPPAYYAPMPEEFAPNANVCVGWNGRWVNASGCN
jgi:hypothetical protein